MLLRNLNSAARQEGKIILLHLARRTDVKIGRRRCAVILSDQHKRSHLDVRRVVAETLDWLLAGEGHAERLIAIWLHLHASQTASKNGRAAQVLSMHDA